MKIVGFRIDTSWIEFGYCETLYSFFSTICYRLENKKWGSRFPIIMNHLYYNENIGVEYQDIKEVRKEISIIKKEFLYLSPRDAIWSFEDNILKIPNNMININYNATNLVDFYSASNNNSIFVQLEYVLEGLNFYKTNFYIQEESEFIKD